jgi:hypothetical protein
MRLQCFTREWYGYALYAGIMGALYVVGLPMSIMIILLRRRHTLFGEGSAETWRVYGFLYDSYGPVAWWWEVEELLRKLFLTALVVLMDPGSPLQVTLAVLFSGWAHVLHAMYKPWRVESTPETYPTYMVQHASLLVTSFVFLMGLLFKVEGVKSSSPVYDALSVIMLLLCIGFIVWWLYEMFSRVVLKGLSRCGLIGGGVRPKGAVPHIGVDAARSGDAASPRGDTGVDYGGRGALLDGVAAAVTKTEATTVMNPMYRRGGSVERRPKASGDGTSERRKAGVVGDDGAGDGGQRTLETPLPSAVAAVRDDAAVVANASPMHVRRHRATVVASAANGGFGGVELTDRVGDVDALSVYFHSHRGT